MALIFIGCALAFIMCAYVLAAFLASSSGRSLFARFLAVSTVVPAYTLSGTRAAIIVSFLVSALLFILRPKRKPKLLADLAFHEFRDLCKKQLKRKGWSIIPPLADITDFRAYKGEKRCQIICRPSYDYINAPVMKHLRAAAAASKKPVVVIFSAPASPLVKSELHRIGTQTVSFGELDHLDELPGM